MKFNVTWWTSVNNFQPIRRKYKPFAHKEQKMLEGVIYECPFCIFFMFIYIQVEITKKVKERYLVKPARDLKWKICHITNPTES